MEEKLQLMISNAEDLLIRTSSLDHISGTSKLHRKIKAELKCLENFKKKKSSEALENHLKSTNLTNLCAILQAIENSPDVVDVLKSFDYEQIEILDNLVVDVVILQGYKWLKVIARKPLAVHRIWAGEGQHGDKDIMAMADEYLLAAKQNPVNYEPPSVCFLFPRGVTQSVHKSLKMSGVEPIGKIISDPDPFRKGGCEEVEPDFEAMANQLSNITINCRKFNLDITTLIVLTSAITNGECDYIFKEEILSKQAEEERLEPALPKLLEAIQGKELITCRTAYDNFQEILHTVGGEGEKRRAEELMRNVTIVDDAPTEYAMQLVESSSVKLRSKVIFGTGESLQAITTTANTAFVRAASNQGMVFSVFYHASRALSEQKQERAIPISKSTKSTENTETSNIDASTDANSNVVDSINSIPADSLIESSNLENNL